MTTKDRGDAGAAGPGSQGCAPEPAAQSPPAVSIAIADPLHDLAKQIEQLAVAAEDLEADAANDFAYARSARQSSRELRALFAEFGIDANLHWPEWIAAIRARLETARG